MEKLHSVVDLQALQEKLQKGHDPNKMMIAVCGGTGCLGGGASQVIETFRKEIAARKLGDKVDFKVTGCHGFCERGTLMVIKPEGIFYQQVKSKDVPEILDRTVLKGEVIERLLYRDESNGEKPIVHEKDVPFYKRQMRLVFGMNGEIDPRNIHDYIRLGGYQAMAKVLTQMEPEQVIDEIKRSGLRGRGGGGFPAGRKWESCRKAHLEPGKVRYVICNADEGDPGAYMDRSLLEGNPHLVIEGMIIGAYAIGSPEGFVYVRHEYPLAVQNATLALEQAREMGLLGENILGTGFSFDIKISRGGGAFVCGESTALMASLEGQIGEPRAKYIHTVESGLYESPSNLNNVETWANVPFILKKGADWYSSIGTENSKGTKVFSLVGKIRNTGLIEVPMGITIREILEDIGGGVPEGHSFKAVQTGGPSGGTILVDEKGATQRVSGPADEVEKVSFVPEALFDLPVDFESLTEAGSMMGSGGMIVMDETSCMVDVARYFINFLTEESCGKCLPCREGLRQMLAVLNRITEGKGQHGDIELLEELSNVIMDTSLCALGGTAPNPLLSTIRYFRDEYEAHIYDKKCPAAVCKALITFTIDPEACTGCGLCLKACPTDAVFTRAAKSGESTPKLRKGRELHDIVQDQCIKCGACFEACRAGAVHKE